MKALSALEEGRVPWGTSARMIGGGRILGRGAGRIFDIRRRCGVSIHLDALYELGGS